MARLHSTEAFKTHRIYLPSTAKAENIDDRVWLDVKDTLLLSDKFEMTNSGKFSDKLVSALASYIVAWNYTEDGTDNSPMIPITADIINREISDPEDVKLLTTEYFNAVGATKGISVAEKKTSLDTTPPSTPASDPQI